jgi:cell division protein FtsI/penicillin-binding protein 2
MRIGGVLMVLAGLLLAGGGARLAYIETKQGEELRREAGRQQTAQISIPALRGEILDTRGRVLAGTIRRPSIFVDPTLVQDAEFAAYSVAPVLGLDAATLERDLRERRDDRFVWLKRRLADGDFQKLEKEFDELIQARRLRAFGVQYEPVRVYPQGSIAPHVVGFVGGELQGQGGIELACEQLLAGKPGKRLSTVDVARRRVRAEECVPATDGSTIVLTIDSYIQQVTQDKLREAVKKYEAEWGAAVVIDPQSGEVLAMASIPDFDPASAVPPDFEKMSEARQEDVKATWRNRAISDAYEPGSVFKPFIASLALEESVVHIDEVFTINGPEHDFGRRTIRDTHPYASLAVHEIVSKSSNIGMGLIGARLGMERLYRYVRMYGFGDVTGIGLPGEHTGLVQDFSRWNPSFSPQSIPIGQEIAVTPIQIVTAFSVFCNGGVLLRPRIVRGIIGPDGETVADYSRPVPMRRVLDPQTAEMFRRQALVETVTDGTGKLARLDDYQVFGKTGTAQIAGPKGHGYGGGHYVASFAGGAPSDYPRVAALVSIYKPTKGGYYGGVISAPVVKEILAETLAYMQVPPELTPGDGAAGGRRGAHGDTRDRKRNDDVGGY